MALPVFSSLYHYSDHMPLQLACNLVDTGSLLQLLKMCNDVLLTGGVPQAPRRHPGRAAELVAATASWHAVFMT